jgi:hypothetical protein
MGNVYSFCECGKCGKLTEVECVFITHRAEAASKAEEMAKSGMPIGKVAAAFCGYCRSYVPLEMEGGRVCPCGHFELQGYNYPEDDPRHWDEHV